MAYVRAKFHDAASILGDYEWQIMWDEEEGRERIRNLERTAVTSGVGFVRQQGEDSPELFRFSGTALHQNQIDKMNDYYDACETRTIFFTDFDDTTHEVLITKFNPKRVRTLKNPRDSSIPLHYWTYEIEMEKVD